METLHCVHLDEVINECIKQVKCYAAYAQHAGQKAWYAFNASSSGNSVNFIFKNGAGYYAINSVLLSYSSSYLVHW